MKRGHVHLIFTNKEEEMTGRQRWRSMNTEEWRRDIQSEETEKDRFTDKRQKILHYGQPKETWRSNEEETRMKRERGREPPPPPLRST